MKQFKTEAAQVATLIKAELKAKFPKYAFSVKSSTFAGGDSVDVNYIATIGGPRLKEVETIADKYQAGHFDGMTDSYEYTNKTQGPTVKWVHVQANLEEVMDQVRTQFKEYYNVNDDQYSNRHHVWIEDRRNWLSTLEHQFAYDKINA